MDSRNDRSADGQMWNIAAGGMVGGRAVAAAVDPANLRELDELITTIRKQDAILRPRRGNRSAAVFEIGRALLKAKELLPHGRYIKWVEEHFVEWPERMAQNCTRITIVLGDKAETVSGLTLRALIALAAETTPEATRAQILRELDGGAELKTRDVVGRIEAARGETSADPRARKLQNARMAAALVRRQLPQDALLTVMAHLGNADAKAFVEALMKSDTTEGGGRRVEDDRCVGLQLPSRSQHHR